MTERRWTAVFCAAVLGGLLALPSSAGDLFPADVTAEKAETAPVIDGVFDPEESWGDPVAHRDSTELKDYAETDPGAESLLDDPAVMITNLDVYMRWDDAFFYYCANVTDPEHFNPETDAAIWRGDSLIFHVVSVPNDDSRARILFGMNNDGETFTYQETAEDGTPGVSGLNDWKISRNEETKITTYEAFFKWEDIIPSEKLGAGESFYLRDLFLLAGASHPEPAAAVVPEGYTNGSRNYWKITLDGGEPSVNWAGTDLNSFFDKPVWLDAAEKVEFEDSGDADAENTLTSDGVCCVFLNDSGKERCSVEFQVKEDGYYNIGVCLMNWQDSVPRAADIRVDDSDRIRLECHYDENGEREQFVTGPVIPLTEGTHTLTLSLPDGFDDTTLKTLYFDYLFFLLSDMAAEIEADPPEPEPEPELEPAPDPKSEPEAEPEIEPEPDPAPAAKEPGPLAAPAQYEEVPEPDFELLSGCASFLGGGLTVLLSVLASAWIAKRE